MKYNIAIVGATGNVGRELISLLGERNFPIKSICAIASRASKNKEINISDERTVKIQSIEDFDFKGTDITFFAVSSAVAAEYIEEAAKHSIVIDKSSYSRMDKQVPLIVPEVNKSDVKQYKNKNIIAVPNCVALPLSMVLGPIHSEFGIERVVVSSYQSVSGAGKKAMNELYTQTKGIYMNHKLEPEYFKRQIAFNIIPQIDNFLDDGYTKEERKVEMETQKILGAKFPISATCVRVPVFVGHSQSVDIALEDDCDIEDIYKLLSQSPGLIVTPLSKSDQYITPIDCVREDAVFVSRIRKSSSLKNGVTLWIACDNLRKGAALNAVQIAETLITEHII
jgi:aspartate-semialdehyde dehydrogenase